MHGLFAKIARTTLAASFLAAAPARAEDWSGVDLSGAWYVLIHYKENESENKDITKFKDFAWSIEQRDNTITWEQYPYVMFDDETELLRRHAMTQHLPWEPDTSLRGKIEQALDVSSRAMTRKRLTGTPKEGFKSLAPLTSGGLNQMGFSTNWDVRFGPEAVRVVLTDSLSGASGLEGMEEATVFEIRERVGPTELKGSYETESRKGTFRMIKSAERRVVK
jgi:hypothetical protein